MKKRIVIVEGCDRTGKSTFIEYLEKLFKAFGWKPVVFHLMGPTKFEDLKFSNDDKSLIQLSKFNDEYDLFREILKADNQNIIILDRSHFGEYVWTKYWKRVGKYTDYLFSDKFMKRHEDLFKETFYINFYLSNVEQLALRIGEFPEDKRIFTENGKSIKENIQDVYDMFLQLLDIVKSYNIETLTINNDKTIKDLYDHTDKIFKYFYLEDHSE